MPGSERREKDLRKKMSKVLPGQQKLNFLPSKSAPAERNIEPTPSVIDLCQPESSPNDVRKKIGGPNVDFEVWVRNAADYTDRDYRENTVIVGNKGRVRHLDKNTFSNHNWIMYNRDTHSIFCSTCTDANLGAGNRNCPYLYTEGAPGYNKWKDKESDLKKHETSDLHESLLA